MENESNKQTAVEWLVKHLCERGYIHAPSFGHSIIDKAIEQAKEIEKQQQKYFFDCGRQYQLTGEGTFKEVWDETYGGKDGK
jgi:hypothetical protein